MSQPSPSADKHIAMLVEGLRAGLRVLSYRMPPRRQNAPIKLTVIESTKVPTIGVGEGTTAVFREVLTYFGLDEFEFLRETKATIKFGIRHKDWRQVGVTYDGPIDDPHQVCEAPPGVHSSWLNQYCVGAGKPVAEPHLFTYLMGSDEIALCAKA